MWIIFYLSVASRATSDCVRYTLEGTSSTIYYVFFVAALILHGVSCFFVCLALNHQRKYRSTGSGNNAANAAGNSSQGNPANGNPANNPSAPAIGRETDPLLAKYSWFKSTITSVEILFFLLFVIYLVFLYQQLANGAYVYELLYLIFLGIQRIPIIFLTLWIALMNRMKRHSRSSGNVAADGPTTKSKIFLFIASILYIIGDVPYPLWAYFLPQTCVFVIASWVDVIHIFSLLSFIFYFLFLRNEYLRNMEETIWTTVSQIQDTFDFRRFN